MRKVFKNVIQILKIKKVCIKIETFLKAFLSQVKVEILCKGFTANGESM